MCQSHRRFFDCYQQLLIRLADPLFIFLFLKFSQTQQLRVEFVYTNQELCAVAAQAHVVCFVHLVLVAKLLSRRVVSSLLSTTKQ